MTHTPTPEQPEALQKAGAIAFRLHRAGDRQAAASIRALLSRVHELETQTAHMTDLVEQANYAHQKMKEAQAWLASAQSGEQAVTQVMIDFDQVGMAGPFPVIDGRVNLPTLTMLDLARMLKPTSDALAATHPAPALEVERDDYKTWYEEAMVASNEAGFVGMSAAETIRALAASQPNGEVA